MKRKLDANDVPTPSAELEAENGPVSFASLGLDSRLLQGINKQEFSTPTLVQSKAIPLALEGRDVIARAKTGSGKTAAYLLPIINSILKRKQTSSAPIISALILVPTRELAEQVHKAAESFSAFCAKDIRSVNLTQKVSDAVQRSLLADSPDIVIATPARALMNLNSSALSLDNLAHLVIDEADLVLSYGYDKDLQRVAEIIPKGVQTILMSATLTDEVDTLKGLFCRKPVVLKLNEADKEGAGVSQFVVKCAEDEKFLLAYVIFKLKLIKGKCIIFVENIDRCYRLKLFLEQFGIKSCILNSELPVNSRIHVVEEFNKGVYDIIIASDEHEIVGDEEDRKESKRQPRVIIEDEGSDEDVRKGEEEEEEEVVTEEPKAQDKEEAEAGDKDEDEIEDGDTEEQPAEPAPKKQKTTKKPRRRTVKVDKEYGVSRGIDFQNVACVLNFDLPTSSKSYTHRIGRTARAGQTGMALSFVIPAELFKKHKSTHIASAVDDEKVLAKIKKHQERRGKSVKPYAFDMKQVEGFRYRMADALKAVTSIAVREARTTELRQELMKSEKLKRHFEENPEDLQHLRHDGELRPARVQAHLKHIPDYLLPKEGKKAITHGQVSLIGFGKIGENRIRKARAANKAKGKGRGKKMAKKINPLKTFRVKK